MGIESLLANVRDAVDDRVWGTAVQLAREGAVRGLSDDGDEIELRVKAPGRAIAHEVFLWPADPDWGCDCETPGEACVHVAAAIISMQKGRKIGKKLPEPDDAYKVELRYDFARKGSALELSRTILYADGKSEPLVGTLADSRFITRRGDAHAEGLLALQSPGPLAADALRRLLVLIEPKTKGTLDGKAVRLSAEDVSFEVRVVDDGEGFKLGLYRPSGIDELFRGAALVGNTLHPTSHGSLTPEQRRRLVRGVPYSQSDVTRLVAHDIPRLRERIDVVIASDRLPRDEQIRPQVEITLQETVAGLQVATALVYGTPAVARVEKGTFKILGDVVPGRDYAAERIVAREFEQRMNMVVGFPHVLPPEQAAAFLRDKLPLWKGIVRGRVDPERFAISHDPIRAAITVAQRPDGRWQLDVSFEGGSGEADVEAVLRAWQMGRSLVPLFEGGYAPLPMDWLSTHGPILRELMDARDATGGIDRNATTSLVELLESEPNVEVPPDLRKLQDFLVASGGLPDIPLPDGFTGELRGYQDVGYRWLRFLRDVELGGILADDMGLGKTIQALAAISDAGGQSIVVAPTSVLRNWEREAGRFTPNLSVNVYHGPQRQLDDSDLILTSYALLRKDLPSLQQRRFAYAVLDEAQSIKNPQSQTAKAACRLNADNRLCLTGTPVENSLDELWSLFRYLMPGFLGSRESFRDRYSRPIENGDSSARTALRKKVRPYVLRRLKKQVAAELPSLTDMVERCEMGTEQRKTYDAVRMAARADVQKAIAERGQGGATMHILEALLRMRQACCDPTLLPGEHPAGSAKLDRLEEIIVELVTEGHKALVFSQWTGLLDRVEPRLRELDVGWARLDGSTRNRQAVIDHFQSDEGPPVFLLSLKAGGTGLNLTAADYVIHLDPWWNPAVQQQATDRAHRIGQDKPVVSIRLVAAHTVEERILDLQDAKRELAEAALGTEGGFVKKLSATELRALFE